MYWNRGILAAEATADGLTLTWDVLKSENYDTTTTNGRD